MPIRMTGLTSGLDTDAIIGALMSAQRMKQTKVEGKRTKLEWKKTTWDSLNTKLYDFYKDYAGKMRFQSSYQIKKASSSNSAKVSATCKSTATNGSYSVKVNKLASAQYVTSGKIGNDLNGKAVKKDTKLSDLGIAMDGSTQINVETSDKKYTLNIDGSMTVNTFVSALQSAGLTASFDEAQGRFFIGAKDSGEDSKFTITTQVLNSSQVDAANALKTLVNYDGIAESSKSTVRSVLSNLQNSTSDKKESDAVSSLMTISDMNIKSATSAYYTKMLTDHYKSEYLDADDKVTDAGKQAYIDAGNKVNDTWTDEDLSKAVTTWIGKTVTKEIKSDEYQKKIAEGVKTGVVTDVDGNNTTIAGTSAEREAEIAQAVAEYASQISAGGTSPGSSVLLAFGMEEVDGTEMKEATSATGMVVVEAGNTEVELNGATLSSSGTTLEVNGLTLNLNGTTDGETITLTVTNDNTAVYDTIKDFVSQYNTILTEMNSLYNASSARGYAVLTDEQKEAMTDDEVEKWETKIKDSLLRRDSTLGSLLDSVRNTMMGSYTASNGKSYCLANLGITTSTDYTERGVLHIKGDEDDTEYSDLENTLEKLLNEDPDLVAEVISGLTSNLYNTMFKKMSTTRLSSALTFYNDKEMNSQLSDYKTEIAKWDTKLNDLENKYYKQFSVMETALSRLQSQQTYMSNLLG